MGCGTGSCDIHVRPRAPAGCPCHRAKERYREAQRALFNPYYGRNAGQKETAEVEAEGLFPMKESYEGDIPTTSKTGSSSSSGDSLARFGQTAVQTAGEAFAEYERTQRAQDQTQTHTSDGYGTDGTMPARSTSTTQQTSTGPVLVLGGLALGAALLSGALKGLLK